jgi:hypothetical protein
MSAQSDALARGLGAAQRTAADSEALLKRTPLPPAAQLDAASSDVSAATAQLQTLLQALEDSTTVAARKAQDAAATGLREQIKLARQKIEQVSARIETLRRKGPI